MPEMSRLEKIKDFLRHVGPNRYKYLAEKAPKNTYEYLKWLRDGAYSFVTFPPAPCSWLCGRGLKRFHFTCLTCFRLIIYFKRRGYEKLRKYTHHIIMELRPPIKSHFELNGKKYRKVVRISQLQEKKWHALPKHYKCYGLFIPMDEHGRVNAVKEYLLKFLLTLAERIAEF
jgi:hypothetical protein